MHILPLSDWESLVEQCRPYLVPVKRRTRLSKMSIWDLTDGTFIAVIMGDASITFTIQRKGKPMSLVVPITSLNLLDEAEQNARVKSFIIMSMLMS